MKSHRLVPLISLLLCSLAQATNTTPTPTAPNSTSNANSAATAVSGAHSDAAAISGSFSGAHVGDTTAIGGESRSSATGGSSAAQVGDVSAHSGDSHATGGNASATQTANGGSATNAGNAQSTNITYRQIRNAPSIAQGSLMPSGCGVAGNAGGSAPNGAGFLGFAFTSDECYRFSLAQSFAAIGMPDSACDVLLTTKAAKRAFKGRQMPDCTAAENRDPAPSVVILDGTPNQTGPSKAEVNETVDRALRKALEK